MIRTFRLHSNRSWCFRVVHHQRSVSRGIWRRFSVVQSPTETLLFDLGARLPLMQHDIDRLRSTPNISVKLTGAQLRVSANSAQLRAVRRMMDMIMKKYHVASVPIPPNMSARFPKLLARILNPLNVREREKLGERAPSIRMSNDVVTVVGARANAERLAEEIRGILQGFEVRTVDSTPSFTAYIKSPRLNFGLTLSSRFQVAYDTSADSARLILAGEDPAKMDAAVEAIEKIRKGYAKVHMDLRGKVRRVSYMFSKFMTPSREGLVYCDIDRAAESMVIYGNAELVKDVEKDVENLFVGTKSERMTVGPHDHWSLRPMLLEFSRNSGAAIEFLEDKSILEISGTDEQLKQCISMVKDSVSQLKTEVLSFEPFKAHHLVSHRSRPLEDIQFVSHSVIHVDAETGKVAVNGRAEAVVKGVGMIKKKLETIQLGEIHCAHKSHNRIRGPKGVTIREIERRSGAAVQLPKPKKGFRFGDFPPPVMITGSAQEVRLAKAHINELLGTSHSEMVPLPPLIHLALHNHAEDTVHGRIAPELVVNFDLEPDNLSMTVSGSESQVAEATNKLRSFVNNLETRIIPCSPAFLLYLKSNSTGYMKRLKTETNVTFYTDIESGRLVLVGRPEIVAAT
eukprot:874980_1